MENILELLYKGELYLYSKFKTTIEQFKLDRNKAFQSYSTFLEKLPDDLKDEFIQLIDNHLDLLPLELEQSFIDGFCIGTRMIVEVFSSPTSDKDI